MNKQIVFGFTGFIASGKGNAVAYLEQQYGASTYRFSTMLRDILDRLYLEHTRDNMVKISECLRERFGEDIMAKTMASDVAKDAHRIIVVEGVRRIADMEHLRKLPHFVLVEIFADPTVRFERLHARAENADDAGKTYEQFLADHERSTEKSIADVIAQATEHIDNNGGLEQLHRQLDALVEKYTKN